MSTLTENSYLMAQLRPSRERKQKRRTRGGKQSRESTWDKSTRGRESRKDQGQKKAEEPQNNRER